MKLKTYLFLLVSLPFSQTALFAQDFGLQLYSLRNQFKNDVEKSLKTIADWGINTVEGGDTYGMEEAEFEFISKVDKPISIGADYEEQKKTRLLLKRLFDMVRVCNVRLDPMMVIGDFENTKAAVKVFNEAGAVLKKKHYVGIPCTRL